MLLERAVELEYRPLMLAELQRKVEAVAQTTQMTEPACPGCGQTMHRKDTRSVSWLARFGRLSAPVSRFVCRTCHMQSRPLPDLLGVEPGRISGSLARLLALMAAVAPYSLAARLAWLLLGVEVNAMSVWRAAQRLGQAAADYSESLSEYHADSRSQGIVTADAPQTVVLSVDGCALGMQVRARRRRRKDGEKLPPLPVVPDGHFREARPVYCCCRKSVSKPVRGVIRWYGGFWSAVSGMPMRYSTAFTHNCGSWVGWGQTQQW